MTSIKKYFVCYSIISLILLLLLYIFAGFYTQETADNIFRVINTDLFTSHTESLFDNYGALFILSPLIKYLNRLNGSIPYYGLIFLLSIFLFLVNFFVVNHIILRKRLNVQNNYIFFLVQLFWFIILLNSVTLTQITKISLLLYISSVSLAIAILIQNISISKYYSIYLVFCVLLASLLRAETLFICSSLLIPFLILCFKSNKPVFSVFIRKYILFIFVILIIIILGNLPYNQNDLNYQHIVTPKVSIWDKGQDINKLVLQNENDSVKFWAARNIFLADPDSLNISFFKKIRLQEVKKSSFIFSVFDNVPFRLQKCFNYIFSSLNHYTLINYIFVLILLLIPLVLLLLQLYRSAVFVSLNILFYFLLIFMLAFILKMEERIMIPFAFLTYYTSFYIILITGQSRKIDYLFKIKLFIFIFIVIFSVIILYDNYFILKGKREDRSEILLAKHHINQSISGKNVIFNLSSWDLIYADLLDTYPLSDNNIYFSIDNGYLFLYNSYIEKMTAITGSSKYIDHIRYLEINKEKTIFISTESRMQLLKRYTETIYKTPFHYYKTDIKPITGFKFGFFEESEYFYEYALR